MCVASSAVVGGRSRNHSGILDQLRAFPALLPSLQELNQPHAGVMHFPFTLTAMANIGVQMGTNHGKKTAKDNLVATSPM
jgi:hypothetical protein